MKKTLVECLENIKDYRVGNGVVHKLIDILVISILAVICRANYWTQVESSGNTKKGWLSKFLELHRGIYPYMVLWGGYLQ